MLTLSTPAAPRFRLTAWKACRMSRAVILPVSECTLIFFMASLSHLVITEFGPSRLGSVFLSVAAVAAIPRLPGKSSGRPILGLGRGANFPHGLVGRSPSSIGFSFHPPRRTTPDLLLSSFHGLTLSSKGKLSPDALHSLAPIVSWGFGRLSRPNPHETTAQGDCCRSVKSSVPPGQARTGTKGTEPSSVAHCFHCELHAFCKGQLRDPKYCWSTGARGARRLVLCQAKA